LEVSGQLHAVAVLPPWKEPWYPLNRRLCGPHSQSGCFGGIFNQGHMYMRVNELPEMYKYISMKEEEGNSVHGWTIFVS
jgi:hypothetical protein